MDSSDQPSEQPADSSDFGPKRNDEPSPDAPASQPGDVHPLDRPDSESGEAETESSDRGAESSAGVVFPPGAWIQPAKLKTLSPDYVRTVLARVAMPAHPIVAAVFTFLIELYFGGSLAIFMMRFGGRGMVNVEMLLGFGVPIVAVGVAQAKATFGRHIGFAMMLSGMGCMASLAAGLSLLSLSDFEGSISEIGWTPILFAVAMALVITFIWLSMLLWGMRLKNAALGIAAKATSQFSFRTIFLVMTLISVLVVIGTRYQQLFLLLPCGLALAVLILAVPAAARERGWMPPAMRDKTRIFARHSSLFATWLAAACCLIHLAYVQTPFTTTWMMAMSDGRVARLFVSIAGSGSSMLMGVSVGGLIALLAGYRLGPLFTIALTVTIVRIFLGVPLLLFESTWAVEYHLFYAGFSYLAIAVGALISGRTLIISLRSRYMAGAGCLLGLLAAFALWALSALGIELVSDGPDMFDMFMIEDGTLAIAGRTSTWMLMAMAAGGALGALLGAEWKPLARRTS